VPDRQRGPFAETCGERNVPSFDVVSEIDLHQLTNAVDQSARVVANRFDFKGIDAGFEREEQTVKLHAEADFQLSQMVDILRGALIKCGIDPLAMDIKEPEGSGKLIRQTVVLRHGLETDFCRKIVKAVKDSKIKVQAQIQGDQVRVTGKKRDELQQVIALLRAAEYEQPLQFTNFRD
jgi:cyclic-di-GMP-binding protein